MPMRYKLSLRRLSCCSKASSQPWRLHRSLRRRWVGSRNRYLLPYGLTLLDRNGSCDPKTQKCCGRNEHFPVYVSSELQGCYVPRTPGFKSSAQQQVFDCYDPPSRLLGPPKVLDTGLETGLLNEDESNLIKSRPALERPLTIEQDAKTWYLYGCYGEGPEQVLNLPSQDPNIGQIYQDIIPGTLDECARLCGQDNAFSYFGMVNGK